jgi:hypothetical protein
MRQIILAATLTVSLVLMPQWARSDDVSDLKTQMEKIEEKNRTLEEALKKQKGVTDRLLKKVDALEQGASAFLEEEAGLEEKPVDHFSGRHEDNRFVDIPKLKISGFMDTGFIAKMTKHTHSKTFRQGEVALFFSSEISERAAFLGELVFYPFSTNPRYALDWQRLVLRYSFSDHFNITIGRMHTALGYWNHAYHHGSWLQTTILRPEIYRFEYDDGVLPVHSVGIELSGSQAFHSFNIEYRLGLINGRAKDIQTIHNFSDENDAKAVSALIGFKPNFVEGLQIGANLYIDQIPPNPAVPARSDQIEEQIIGAHLIYLQQGIEFMVELFKIHHRDRASGNDHDSLGYYFQGGYKIDSWTPYYRFDFVNLAEGDPFFIPLQTDVTKHTVGIRWDLFTWNALKLEYRSADLEDGDREDSINVNSSVAF